MSIICPACKYDENPDDAEFCEACGDTLPKTAPPPEPPMQQEEISPSQDLQDEVNTHQTENIQDSSPQVTHNTIDDTTDKLGTVSSAKLIATEANAPIPEFIISRNSVTIGKFDPDTGPVDVNLEKFIDSDNISRKHAELYQERGQWKIKDLGSTNGVFIRRSSESNFGARITLPETLNSGDEIAIAQTFLRFQTD